MTSVIPPLYAPTRNVMPFFVMPDLLEPRLDPAHPGEDGEYGGGASR